jgi:hypothetical protein
MSDIHLTITSVPGTRDLVSMYSSVQDGFPCEVKEFNICVVALKHPNDRPW